jgi:hypothetical protein
MSLFKILITRGSIQYSCWIQAKNTAQACQFAKMLFKQCDSRIVIQL